MLEQGKFHCRIVLSKSWKLAFSFHFDQLCEVLVSTFFIFGSFIPSFGVLVKKIKKKSKKLKILKIGICLDTLY